MTMRKPMLSWPCYLLFLALQACALAHGAPVAEEAAACKPLLPRSAADQDAVINSAGAYCVASDFRQPTLSGAGHNGPRYGHALIKVGGGDVTIDLQQHTLHTDARSHGLLLAARANVGVARDLKRDFGASSRIVTVRNGVIDLRGIGTGVRFVRWWDLIKLDETVPPEARPYEHTRYVLENLTIKTDNVGIQLEGDGNIVRDCVIESDGDAAIIMAGPNSQIVNNTVILGDPLVPTWTKAAEQSNQLAMLYKTPRARQQTRAAIVLQDGSGSVVRGNRIEVKGKSSTRHSILLNNGSRDVLIEGNTFIDGIDAPLALAGSSSRLKGNLAPDGGKPK
jgi:hypothetical protein